MEETKQTPVETAPEAETPVTETAPETAAKESGTAAKGKMEKKSDRQAELTDLKQKLEDAEAALAATKDQYQRMLAEYANYKRRTEQEKEQIGLFTKAELLTGLLTTVDNMEKAVAADPGEGYKEGVDLVMRQFADALRQLGLEEIEADGAPFDPNVHHAVMREDADGVEPDTVTAVFQKGYKLGDRVLRPAMVKVAN